MKIGKCILIIAAALLTAIPVLPAQQAPAPPPPPSPPTPPSAEKSSQPESFYRLEFAIREMEGEKLVDTRHYSLWVRAGKTEMVTAGSEVPYASGQSNISYRSIGVSISCHVKETNGNPWLSMKLNLSGVAPPEKGMEASSTAFRNISIDAEALLSLGKSTTVGSVEDPATRRRVQVDVTATKLK